MTRAEDWGSISDDAIAAFESADDGEQVPFAYAYLIRGIGRRDGWEDPRIATYLDKLYSLRNPDGGWGLGYPFNAFSGPDHPADTTFTITMTDHVGPSLIEAYAAGRPEVTLADISTLASLVMTTQTCTFPVGKAIAYSRATSGPGSDAVTITNNKDVHNVNGSAALFLLQAQAAGVTHGGLNKRVVDMARREVTAYQPSSTRGAWWAYAGTGALSDTDHCALLAEVMLTLGYPLGREVAYNILANGRDDEAAARIAWARLAGAAPPMDNPLLWLELADQWMADVAAFVATCTTRQKAQVACWASRAADQASEVL